MSSREEILGRVRAGLQRNAGNAAAAREVMRPRWPAAARAQTGHGHRPAPAGALPPQVGRQSSTVDIVATTADVPAAVARYLAT
jgi:hypothetical protein